MRLWDRAQMPHFVRVHKGLIKIQGKATFHSVGGLWAAVLEKAMTAIDKEGRYDPEGASYGRIEGGLSHIAFQALLGVEGESTELLPTEYHYEPGGADFADFRKILKGDHDNCPSALIKTALFGGLVDPTKLNLFYDTVWEPWAEDVGLYGKWMKSFGALLRRARLSPGGPRAILARARHQSAPRDVVDDLLVQLHLHRLQ